MYTIPNYFTDDSELFRRRSYASVLLCSPPLHREPDHAAVRQYDVQVHAAFEQLVDGAVVPLVVHRAADDPLLLLLRLLARLRMLRRETAGNGNIGLQIVYFTHLL